MKPPWIEFPHIPMGSAGWRMGWGEDFMNRWKPWYAELSKGDQAQYQIHWPEPPEWNGFFEFCGKSTMPPALAEHHARLRVPQRLPAHEERIISDPYRAVWLMRHHMRRLGHFDVAARYPFPYLGERKGECLIGYFEAPDETWWRVSNPEIDGLTMVRIDDELLRNWLPD